MYYAQAADLWSWDYRVNPFEHFFKTFMAAHVRIYFNTRPLPQWLT
jgi:hypothetical protein